MTSASSSGAPPQTATTYTFQTEVIVPLNNDGQLEGTPLSAQLMGNPDQQTPPPPLSLPPAGGATQMLSSSSSAGTGTVNHQSYEITSSLHHQQQDSSSHRSNAEIMASQAPQDTPQPSVVYTPVPLINVQEGTIITSSEGQQLTASSTASGIVHQQGTPIPNPAMSSTMVFPAFNQDAKSQGVSTVLQQTLPTPHQHVPIQITPREMGPTMIHETTESVGTMSLPPNGAAEYLHHQQAVNQAVIGGIHHAERVESEQVHHQVTTSQSQTFIDRVDVSDPFLPVRDKKYFAQTPPQMNVQHPHPPTHFYPTRQRSVSVPPPSRPGVINVPEVLLSSESRQRSTYQINTEGATVRSISVPHHGERRSTERRLWQTEGIETQRFQSVRMYRFPELPCETIPQTATERVLQERIVSQNVIKTEGSTFSLAERFGAANVGRDELGEYVIKRVEVPVHEEKTTRIPKKEIRETIVKKTVPQVVEVERLVDKWEVQEVVVSKIVEKIEEKIVHKPVKEVRRVDSTRVCSDRCRRRGARLTESILSSSPSAFEADLRACHSAPHLFPVFDPFSVPSIPLRPSGG